MSNASGLVGDLDSKDGKEYDICELGGIVDCTATGGAVIKDDGLMGIVG